MNTKMEKIIKGRVKYNDLLDEWILLQKNYVKEATYSTYCVHIQKHIKPYFQDIYISKLSYNHIQEFIDFKLKYGRLDDQGGLSPKTVKELINVIKLSLKYAIKNNYISSFNFDFKIPNHISQKKILSTQECDKLIHYLKNDNSSFSIGILLILSTGMRIGEICALKNNDINIETQELYINKTLQRIYDVNNKSSKILVSSAKTIQSNRIIPIPKSLLPYLNIKNNDHYFLTQSSQYIEPRIFRYKFKKILKKLQISEVTVHSLRHYFATKCIELGFDYNCLSEILGHSSPSTTMNLYVHCKNEHKKNCMNRITI